MAQQSARRDQENQGFPPCLEHALGDLDRIRELPYRPATVRRRSTGRTDGSIRLRVRNSQIHSCAEGGVHRWIADIQVLVPFAEIQPSLRATIIKAMTAIAPKNSGYEMLRSTWCSEFR